MNVKELFSVPFVRSFLDRHFPEDDSPDITVLTAGGSDRAFYRVKNDERSFVLCVTANREELQYYIDFGNYFISKGISVPMFLECSLQNGMVFMEDGGDVSLLQEDKGRLK